MQGDYEKLKALVLSIEDEVKKAGAGNKSAGTRVRKAMQEIKNLAQAVRVDVLEKREDGDSASGSGQNSAAKPQSTSGLEKPETT